MHKNFQGYDVTVDSAETDQQMCTPMLLSRFEPKIKTKLREKL